jgi:hypothetical protein
VKTLHLPLLILLSACSMLGTKGTPKEGKRTFNYNDVSGKYIFTRESKLVKNRLITRAQISNSSGKLLEKSIMVSQIGTIKDERGRTLSIRPFGSEFTVWLEGKKYQSRMKIDPKSKSMLVELNSPEEKWQGRTSTPFPKGKQFCFFSQIPDCLYHNNHLFRAQQLKGEGLSFYVVWDSFPYVQEQLSNVGTRLFSSAVVKYEGSSKNVLRYQVEVGGQTMLYQFSKSYDLVRMFWVAQGISIMPPGEEVSDVED